MSKLDYLELRNVTCHINTRNKSVKKFFIIIFWVLQQFGIVRFFLTVLLCFNSFIEIPPIVAINSNFLQNFY